MERTEVPCSTQSPVSSLMLPTPSPSSPAAPPPPPLPTGLREAPWLKCLPHCLRLVQILNLLLLLLTSSRWENLTRGRGRKEGGVVQECSMPAALLFHTLTRVIRQRGLLENSWMKSTSHGFCLTQKRREDKPQRNRLGNPAPAAARAAQRKWEPFLQSY